jgi:L-ascorbate metabolism protein UlaG (beta-lactamase superfamily)
MAIIIGIIILITLSLYIYLHFFISGPIYEGPLSKNFDGTHFHNLESIEQKETIDVLKWLITRDREEWDNSDTIKQRKIPFAEIKDKVRVTFINHATILIQTPTHNILTDPIFSERASPVEFAGPKRKRPPGVKFEELPPIHLVMISHNHYDHLDLSTLTSINEQHKPLFITPLGVDLLLHRHNITKTLAMDWDQDFKVEEDLIIHCVPAQHFSGRGISDRNKTLWAGYVIDYQQKRYYFAGDTGYGNFFKQIGKKFQSIEVAILPIGAYKPRWFMQPIHTSPEEAVLAFRDVNAKYFVPMHYYTFQMADEGMNTPLNDLNEAINKHGIDHNAIHILREGESKDY